MAPKLLATATLISFTTFFANAFPQFTDGGFEQLQTFYKIVYTGESFGGWTVVGGSVELVGSGLWQPAGGNVSLDSVGIQVRGAFAQNLTFDGSGQYSVQFDLSRNPLIDYSPVRFGVWYKPPSSQSFIGLGLFEYGEINSAANMMWRHTGTSDFTAEAGQTTFMFVSLTGGGQSTPTWGGAAIDNVTLVSGASAYSSIAPPSFESPAALFGHYDLYDNTPPGGPGTGGTGGSTTVPESGNTALMLMFGVGALALRVRRRLELV
jgi:hypothetical protein